MGNTGSAEFAEAAQRLKTAPLTTPEELQDVFSRLIPEKRELKAKDVFSAIQPDDIRYLRNRQPRNLACLLIEAGGILADQAGEPHAEKICSTLNAARLLTRVLPIVFEEPEHPDDFVNKVFWEQCLPIKPRKKRVAKKAPAAAASTADAPKSKPSPADGSDASAGAGAETGASSSKSETENTAAPAPEGNAESSSSAAASAESAAPASSSTASEQAADAGAPAEAPAEAEAEVEVETTYLYERIRGADESYPLGTQLVQSTVALLFSPDLTVAGEQFEAFLLKISDIREQRKVKEDRERRKAERAATKAKAKKNTAALEKAAAASAAPGAVAEEEEEHGDNEGQEEEEGEAEEQEEEAEEGETIPDEANAVWPMLLWRGGVGFPDISSPLSAQYTPARVDMLRLLLALSCGPLYMDPQPQDPARSRFLDELTGGACPFAPTLFYSLLNEALSYDPTGWGIPYASALVTDRAEPLATLCLQALLVCLDYAPITATYLPNPSPNPPQAQAAAPAPVAAKEKKARAKATVAAAAPSEKEAPSAEASSEGEAASSAAAAPSEGAKAAGEDNNAEEEAGEHEAEAEAEAEAEEEQEQAVEYGPQFNVFRSLLSGLSEEIDFASVFSGITRLLESLPTAGVGSILPGSRKGFSSHAEVLVLLWKLLEENPSFLRHVLNDCDVTLLLGPILYVMWTSRKDVARSGEIHLCTFLLLLLSGDRAFGVACNKPCPASKVLPSDCPVIEGTYSDALIVTLHKVVVDGLPKLAPLYTCFLTIICNVSPYAKHLGVVACAKLVHLVELFAAPKFLFARQGNWAFVQQLVESLNNLVQYQYEGNAVLVYTLLRRKHVFERLYHLSPDKWRLEQQQQRKRAASASTPTAAASAAGTGVAAGSSDDASEGGRREVEVPQSAISTDRSSGGWRGPTEDWWRERVRPQLGLGTLLRLVAYLHPLVERFVRMQSGEDTVAAARGYAPVMLSSGAVASLPAGAVSASALAAAGLAEQPSGDALTQQHQGSGSGSGSSGGVAGYGSVDDGQVVDFIHATTVVGILPQPHPIMTRRYQPNAFTATWFTTFLWSTVFITQMRELPLFDADALRMFAIGVA